MRASRPFIPKKKEREYGENLPVKFPDNTAERKLGGRSCDAHALFPV